jgi:predicted nucleotidyltransferase
MGIPERWAGHPPLPHDLEERLPGVVERLQEAGATLVYLFGSVGRANTERAPADLDLAVLGMTEDRFRVAADLQRVLETDRLDLVRLETADPELRFRVVAEGTLLHSASPDVENRFEEAALRTYRDLAPLRRTQQRYVRQRHGVDGP